jgi:hypothetical protein
MDAERPAKSGDGGEWTYLTYDVERPCAICGDYVHRGQAVGYVDGRLVHAKCHRREGQAPAVTDPPRDRCA